MKLCAELVQAVQAHAGVVILCAGAVAVAFASTMPEHRPKTLDDYWAWARDFTRQIASTTRPNSLPKV